LDSAMGRGSNRQLVEDLCRKLPCQVGGGIRSAHDAQTLFDYGARKVIFGSSLIRDGAVDATFAKELYDQHGADRLVFAVDARGGRVAIHGWKSVTNIEPLQMIQQLEPVCSAFLYTHIDTEGLMQGIPLEAVRALRQQTSRRLIVAGGIRSVAEIEELNRMGVDAVVGMAIYSGMLKI
jgi:phosphoribosylformimino-5-aminoimidazole carboxamide ribotide isomerase